jgi:hypothetical protein
MDSVLTVTALFKYADDFDTTGNQSSCEISCDVAVIRSLTPMSGRARSYLIAIA